MNLKKYIKLILKIELTYNEYNSLIIRNSVDDGSIYLGDNTFKVNVYKRNKVIIVNKSRTDIHNNEFATKIIKILIKKLEFSTEYKLVIRLL